MASSPRTAYLVFKMFWLIVLRVKILLLVCFIANIKQGVCGDCKHKVIKYG